MSQCLTAADILRVWERGRDCHPLDRALLLLRAAYPELPDHVLPTLSVGERDARLMRVRAATVGDRCDAVADCPNCAAALEVSISVDEICGEGSDTDRQLNTAPVDAEVDGIKLRLHRPDGRDLAEIAGAANLTEARRSLLRRCIVVASRDGQSLEPEQLPDALQERISELLAQADPRSDVVLDVQCEACGHTWPILFDILEFFWLEIEVLARRLVNEVATLAHAFGWREGDIIEMSPARRRLYLETVM
jgi:hypothetical protein